MPLSQYSRLRNYGTAHNLTITQPGNYAAFVTPRITQDGRSQHHLRLYPPNTPAAAHSFVSIDVTGSDFHSADTGVGTEGLLFAVWLQIHEKGTMALVESSRDTEKDAQCIVLWTYANGKKLLFNSQYKARRIITVSPRVGQWYHVAVTLSQSKKSAKLYWDGENFISAPWQYSKESIGDTKTIYLGHRYRNRNRYRANISVACFRLASWKQLAQSRISEAQWISNSRSC